MIKLLLIATYRKRQNLYYVKVQERVSTLDAGDDYIMTVTTITGPCKTSEEVPIHNKFYLAAPVREDLTEPFSLTESCTLPHLQTCRSPSQTSLTSGFDERSIESIFSSPLRQIEAVYDELCREASQVREVSETPLPDLEEIVEVDLSPAQVPPGPDLLLLAEAKKNSFLLVKKPIVPEVLYKWQRGFRRDNSGRYGKVSKCPEFYSPPGGAPGENVLHISHFQVTILKLTFKYEESQKLLPSNLWVTNMTNGGGGGVGGDAPGDLMKTVAVSDNAGVVEFVMEDNDEGNRSVDNTAMIRSSDLSANTYKQSKTIILVKS